MSDFVYIETFVEMGIAEDRAVHAIPCDEWARLDERKREELCADLAVDHQNNVAPCGSNVIENPTEEDIAEAGEP